VVPADLASVTVASGCSPSYRSAPVDGFSPGPLAAPCFLCVRDLAVRDLDPAEALCFFGTFAEAAPLRAAHRLICACRIRSLASALSFRFGEDRVCPPARAFTRPPGTPLLSIPASRFRAVLSRAISASISAMIEEVFTFGSVLPDNDGTPAMVQPKTARSRSVLVAPFCEARPWAGVPSLVRKPIAVRHPKQWVARSVHERSLVVSLNKCTTNLLPAQAQGKSLQSIHICYYDESLDLELAFEGGLALELSLRVEHRHVLRLLQWEGGNSSVLERQEG